MQYQNDTFYIFDFIPDTSNVRTVSAPIVVSGGGGGGGQALKLSIKLYVSQYNKHFSCDLLGMGISFTVFMKDIKLS